MRYLSTIKGESQVEELTKERTRFLLANCYKEEFVNDIIDNEKAFRLQTMTRVIWTNENGLVPMAGFIGVCE